MHRIDEKGVRKELGLIFKTGRSVFIARDGLVLFWRKELVLSQKGVGFYFEKGRFLRNKRLVLRRIDAEGVRKLLREATNSE